MTLVHGPAFQFQVGQVCHSILNCQCSMGLVSPVGTSLAVPPGWDSRAVTHSGCHSCCQSCVFGVLMEGPTQNEVYAIPSFSLLWRLSSASPSAWTGSPPRNAFSKAFQDFLLAYYSAAAQLLALTRASSSSQTSLQYSGDDWTFVYWPVQKGMRICFNSL